MMSNSIKNNLCNIFFVTLSSLLIIWMMIDRHEVSLSFLILLFINGWMAGYSCTMILEEKSLEWRE